MHLPTVIHGDGASFSVLNQLRVWD